MSLFIVTLRSLRFLAGVCLLGAPAWSQFVVDNSSLPSGSANNSTTENVDFGDVDQDGDWDIGMADGGDNGNDQNRIWINQGGAQAGTLGDFVDRTSVQFPSVSDDSRDIEFVDFDNDSDLDIYISNTAQLSNQGNRWWTNQGSGLGGTIGFYVDETAARWANLGDPGSSIAPSQLIAPGTFIDWSCDCDFGDLDNDGDMDLVHSSYGGTFGGSVPTRIFLNDGNGVFEEFNPSGFQLSGPTINNGNPGLWCDGVQSSDTTLSTGAQCDIASSALDIDIGDIDGDFDLDILHGARNEPPRMFANRLEGSSLAPGVGSGILGFRDVTGAVYPAGYYLGNSGHYEQEMADFDGDGDLDIYGLNWRTSGGFTDVVLTNNAAGVFGGLQELDGSNPDDNEGDFIDADNDGDLDLYVANFSGQDRLYINDGGGNFSLGSVPSFSATSLDADVCDTDGDGDYDVLVAEDNFAANTFLRNVSAVPDTTPPYIPRIERPRFVNRADPFPVRAQVYDNAPYYITWYNATWIEISVNGCRIPDIPALSSGGQIFRAMFPANLEGNVVFRWVSQDEYANRGHSAWATYIESGANKAPGPPAGGPTVSLPMGVARLEALTTVYPGAPFYLAARHGAPGAPYVVVFATDRHSRPLALADGARVSLRGTVLATLCGTIGPQGHSLVSPGDPPGDLAPGSSAYAQLFVLGPDAVASSEVLHVVSH
jgi:hypothetical protein